MIPCKSEDLELAKKELDIAERLFAMRADIKEMGYYLYRLSNHKPLNNSRQLSPQSIDEIWWDFFQELKDFPKPLILETCRLYARSAEPKLLTLGDFVEMIEKLNTDWKNKIHTIKLSIKRREEKIAEQEAQSEHCNTPATNTQEIINQLTQNFNDKSGNN